MAQNKLTRSSLPRHVAHCIVYFVVRKTTCLIVIGIIYAVVYRIIVVYCYYTACSRRQKTVVNFGIMKQRRWTERKLKENNNTFIEFN